jgi:hypothetical protein
MCGLPCFDDVAKHDIPSPVALMDPDLHPAQRQWFSLFVDGRGPHVRRANGVRG